MIVYYTGIPGSGKTYNAVYTIYNNFSKDKKAKKDLKKYYINCYTNINGFKFDLVENVYSLNEMILDDQIKELHKIYLDTKKLKDTQISIDDVLIEKCKEYSIYKSFFVFDEAHNYFDTQKAHLVWWLTYHRHLHHDIVLITQNLSLINAKYKIAETYYKAIPTSLKLLGKTFGYHAYADSRMTQNGKFATNKVPKLKEVFELYQSGDSVDTKNVIKKFLLIALFFVILFFIAGYFFLNSKQSSSPEPKREEQRQVRHVKENATIEETEIDIDTMIYNIVFCSDTQCSIDDITYPKNTLFKLLKNYKLQVLEEVAIIDTFTQIHLLIDKKYKSILMKPINTNQDNIEDEPQQIVSNVLGLGQ